MSSYTRRERGRVRISNMCAPFTAIEFLKALVHALMTYKSPLSFDGVVLVEMFDIGVNNAHWCQTNRSLLYTPTATVCIWRTPVVADSLLVPTVDHLEPGIPIILFSSQHIIGVYRCDLILLHCPIVWCSSPYGVECSCCRRFSLHCIERILFSCTDVWIFRQSCCV